MISIMLNGEKKYMSSITSVQDLKYITDPTGKRQEVIVPVKLWVKMTEELAALREKQRLLLGLQEACREVKQQERGELPEQTLTKFDAAAYLDNEETIAEYLTAALEDENPDVFLTAIADVAKARGMAAIAKSTGLGRERLHKALAPGAKPRYDTIIKVLHGLGVKITVTR